MKGGVVFSDQKALHTSVSPVVLSKMLLEGAVATLVRACPEGRDESSTSPRGSPGTHLGDIHSKTMSTGPPVDAVFGPRPRCARLGCPLVTNKEDGGIINENCQNEINFIYCIEGVVQMVNKSGQVQDTPVDLTGVSGRAWTAAAPPVPEHLIF